MSRSLQEVAVSWWHRLVSRPSKRGKPFNLLHTFSLLSFLVIGTVALALGYIATRYVVQESIERDALLTAQFIHAIAAAEIRHVDLPPQHTMGDALDTRKKSRIPHEAVHAERWARSEFLDHIKHLPDVLLVNIYGVDRTIIWSTNRELIGKQILGNDDLEEAFSGEDAVSSSYHRVDESKQEQKFPRAPEQLFIENYIPLFNVSGREVVAMVEIYKEPEDLIERIDRGYRTIWISTAIGGGVIFLCLFGIVWKASGQLALQQEQLISNETYVLLGEMSSAVAHSLRNPLATIRSSAELAQEVAGEQAQKNIQDIINQVDRMSRWVRELLQFAIPITGKSESVDMNVCIREALSSFDQQFEGAKVSVAFSEKQMPLVRSSKALMLQALHSLFANAIEAMPGGGDLQIDAVMHEALQEVEIRIRDTGKGMTPEQQTQAFKPFFTTKHGGLGVGLSLVRRVMRRFGGDASLSSQEQVGTCICLRFEVATGGPHGSEHIGRR